MRNRGFMPEIICAAMLVLFGGAGILHAEPSVAPEQPEPLPPRAIDGQPSPHFRNIPKNREPGRRPAARFQTTPALLSQAALNKSPYYFIGYVSFFEGGVGYQGSGTVIRPRSVLTCAHVLWTPGIGWSTGIKFYRARYGASYRNVAAPSRIYIHGSYQPNAKRYGDTSYYTFAYDIGWMTFATRVAGGGYAGYATNYGALTGPNPCVALGYGGGTYPKYCEPSRVYREWSGTAYFTNSSYDHEGGMSGGPIFATISGKKYVDAVVVSSGGGIRAIDSYVYGQINSLP